MTEQPKRIGVTKAVVTLRVLCNHSHELLNWAAILVEAPEVRHKRHSFASARRLFSKCSSTTAVVFSLHEQSHVLLVQYDYRRTRRTRSSLTASMLALCSRASRHSLEALSSACALRVLLFGETRVGFWSLLFQLCLDGSHTTHVASTLFLISFRSCY